jgi:hypothetical protein
MVQKMQYLFVCELIYEEQEEGVTIIFLTEERRALKAAVALSSGDLPEDQKWVKDKLSEIHSEESTEESSPKRKKIE